jgi:AcrR family transcriptional regulator
MQGAPVFRGAEVAIPTDDTRLRLVVGMATALAEKGFAGTTIADVARHARASKRTFYEHFETKEDCLIACYELASEVALQTTMQAASPSLSWDDRVRAATAAYLRALEQNPSLTRTLMMDIYAAGPKGMKVRRKGLIRFAEWLRGLVEQERGRYGARRLSPAMAAAVVGGINEMVLLAVEEGRAHALTELADTAYDLVQAVLGSLSAPRPARSRRSGTAPRA